MTLSRKMAVIGSTAALAVVLAGCGPEVRVVEDQSGAMSGQSGDGSQSGADAGPVLDEARIRRVVDGVQKVIDEADDTGDASILPQRLVDGALQMRTAQMGRAERTGTEFPPLEIEINVASATMPDRWPRLLLVGGTASTDAPADVYLFTQADAQSDYMLADWVPVLGGNSVRGVAVKSGSEALTPDSTGFRLTPRAALDTYVQFLNEPDNADVQIFDDKTFVDGYRKSLEDLNASVQAAGNVTAKAQVVDFPVMGVSLTTGEALVAGSFTYTHTYQRTVNGSTMSVGGTVASYLDDPAVKGTVTATYLVNMFFTVPAEGSDDPIRIVGAERSITKVDKDDQALPEGETNG